MNTITQWEVHCCSWHWPEGMHCNTCWSGEEWGGGSCDRDKC